MILAPVGLAYSVELFLFYKLLLRRSQRGIYHPHIRILSYMN